MGELFSWDFNRKKATNQIMSHLDKIDEKIIAAAPTWPIKQINRVDLAILRLSVYELLLNNNTPPKVVVDEAVELAKAYGGNSSPSFVNGVLGKIIEMEGIQT